MNRERIRDLGLSFFRQEVNGLNEHHGTIFMNSEGNSKRIYYDCMDPQAQGRQSVQRLSEFIWIVGLNDQQSSEGREENRYPVLPNSLGFGADEALA
ncbi:MAG TPA: hypothetical protein VGX70_14005 [Gemmataceae bacterium]|jgi:hypothetical protein|nr:hypothetical protein [Gemmataceae bacterium]